MGTELGYSEAITSYLNVVLHNMVMQGVLNKMMADQLSNSRATWEQQFVNSITGQQLEEVTFQQKLKDFLLGHLNYLNNAMRGGGGGGYPQAPMGFPPSGYPNNPGGYPMAPGGYPPGGMMPPVGAPVAPVGYTGGYGARPGPMAPMTDTFVAPSVARVPINKPAHTAMAPMTTPVAKVKVEQSIPKGYTPPWTADPSLVDITVTDTYGAITVTESRYPKNDHEIGMTYISLESEDSIGDVYDVCSMLKRYYGTGSAVFARIKQKNAIALRGASVKKVQSTIDSVGKIVATKESPIDKLEKVIEMLEQEPQNIYSAFEKMFVSMFNIMLKGRRLQDHSNASYGLDVPNMSGIVQFSPSSNSSQLSVFTQVGNYSKAYDSVIRDILMIVSEITIGESSDEAKVAINSMGGTESLRWCKMLDTVEGLEQFHERYTVLTYEHTFAVSNIMFEELPSTAPVVDEGKTQFVQVDDRTGNFDNVMTRITGNSPMNVYCMDTGDVMFIVGSSIGNRMLYIRK